MRILSTCDDRVVRDAAEKSGMQADVRPVSADRIRGLENADCLIVEASEHARTARAAGFDGAIIVLAAPSGPNEAATFQLQGTYFVLPDGGADALSKVLSRAIPRASDGTPAAIDPTLARTRRLVAAGEMAVGLRHALNNPLAALMAEIQLLQLEARDEETRAAAGRMLELVRRLTEVSRTLESVRDE
jgi:signal transduction histidine kinase